MVFLLPTVPPRLNDILSFAITVTPCSALTTALQDGGAGGGRSYAQATAGPGSQAGEPDAGGGRAAQKARRMEAKLRFYVNDRPVPSNYTIFQAVNDLFREHREEEASSESMSGRRRRLWEETHTLYYSR